MMIRATAFNGLLTVVKMGVLTLAVMSAGTLLQRTLKADTMKAWKKRKAFNLKSVLRLTTVGTMRREGKSGGYVVRSALGLDADQGAFRLDADATLYHQGGDDVFPVFDCGRCPVIHVRIHVPPDQSHDNPTLYHAATPRHSLTTIPLFVSPGESRFP